MSNDRFHLVGVMKSFCLVLFVVASSFVVPDSAAQTVREHYYDKHSGSGVTIERKLSTQKTVPSLSEFDGTIALAERLREQGSWKELNHLIAEFRINHHGIPVELDILSAISAYKSNEADYGETNLSHKPNAIKNGLRVIDELMPRYNPPSVYLEKVRERMELGRNPAKMSKRSIDNAIEGRRWYDEGKNKEAIVFFRKSVDPKIGDPYDGSTWLTLSSAEFRAFGKDFKRKKKVLEEGLKYDPTSPPILSIYSEMIKRGF